MTHKERIKRTSPTQLRVFASSLRWGLELAWRAAPKLIVAWIGLIALQSFTTPAIILATRETINVLGPLIGKVPLRALLVQTAFPVGAIATLLLTTQILAGLSGLVKTTLSEWLRDYVQIRIHEKTVTLDLAFFESPESYDLLHRARVDAISVPAQLIEHLGNVAQSGLALVFIGCLLALYSPLLPALLFVTAVPGLWVVGRYALAANKWRLQNTANERRTRYLDWLLTQRETAPEIRLFDLGAHFRDAFAKLRAQLRQGRTQLEAAELRAELVASSVGWAGLLSAMLWIIWRTSAGLARLGDIVMCYQSFQQGQKLLRTSLDGAGGIYKGLLFLENLRGFLQLESTLHDPPVPRSLPVKGRTDIRFEQVNFAYPDVQRNALSDVSLDLRGGHITAIVGDNGAGKSTLIKLLCRFYDPSSGRISIDGVDIKALSSESLRQNITVLFQEPLRHHGSASENIALGDLAASDNAARIEKAAIAAGADGPISRLPEGYQTVLGKWFGGAELSTGEWQRVALARAFLRQSSIIALDEPTSAMDAWAEADWLDRFRTLVQGQTALVITHRFTTAMMADYIYVMQSGRVTESGTHRELLRINGHYAKAWNEQMRFRGEEMSRVSAG